MRRIWHAATHHRHRRVENRVEWRRAFLERVSVDIHLERTAHLPIGLSCTIELRILETVPANYRFDLAGRIVDREHRTLRRRLLLQLHAHCRFPDFLDRKLREVTD